MGRTCQLSTYLASKDCVLYDPYIACFNGLLSDICTCRKANNTFLQEATTMMNTNNAYFENLYRIGCEYETARAERQARKQQIPSSINSIIF